MESYQKKLTPGKIIAIGVAIGILAGSVYALSTIETSKLLPALGALGAVITFMTAATLVLNKWGTGTGMKGLMGMASAILILSKAVENLAEIDPTKMAIAIGGLVALMTAVGVYSVSMSKWGGEITKSAGGLIAFSVAIMVLSKAVEQLTKFDPAQLAIAIGGIMALTLSVAASSKILAKSDSKGSVKLLAFAASVKTLAKAVVILADLSWEELLKGLSGVGVLLVELGVFSKLVNDKQMISTATGMVILAGALLALTVPLNILSVIKWQTFADGLAKIGIMMTTLGVALKLMPKNLPSIGFGLMEVSAALLVMSGAVKIMGSMKWSEVAKSLVVLGGSLTILAVALNAMRGTLAGSAALLVASGALVVLSGALKALGAMSLEAIGKSLLALAGSMAILAVAAYALVPVAPVLLGMSASMLAFAASLGILGVALIAIGAGLGMIATAFVTAGAMTGAAITALITMVEQLSLVLINMMPLFAEAAGKAIAAFAKAIGEAAPVIIGALVKLIGALLDGLKTLIPQIVETIVTIIDEVLKSLATHIESITSSLVQIILGIIKGITPHLPELISATMELIISLFEGIFDAVNQLDFGTVVRATVGAAIFAVFLGVITAIAPLIPGAMGALLGFGLVVVELMGILAILGGLAQIPGIKWFIEEGGNVLESIGQAIGKFFGGIVGGLVEGATSTLPKVGKSLSEFIQNAKPFFDGIKDIDDDAVNSVGKLSIVVGMMTASSLVDSMIEFITGGSPIVEFGKKLAEFAPYFRQYADTMSGVDSGVLTATSNAAKTLAEFAREVPRDGSLGDILFGSNDIVKFGQKLAEFAPHFKRYADSISGIDTGVITASATAAKTLAEFAKEVPNTGGLVSLFTGDNTLSSFAKELAKFGPSLKSYSDSVVGINKEAIDTSVEATKSIISFAKEVPNTGGLVSLFTGDNNLTSLAKQLTKFGPSLKSYSDSVAGLDTGAIDNSLEAAKSIIKVMESMPKDISKNADDFYDGTKNLGKAISKFYDNISSIEYGQLDVCLEGIKKLVQIIATMGNVNSDTVSSFSSAMKQLGDVSVNKFVESFSNAGPQVESAISNLINIANVAVLNNSVNFGASGEMLMRALSMAITTSGIYVTDAIIKSIQNGFNSITSMGPQFMLAGQMIISGLTMGMIMSSSNIVVAISSLMTTIVTVISSYSGVLAASGQMIFAGFIIGIQSSSAMVVGAVSQMMITITNIITSYSAQFSAAGMIAFNGFVIGINSTRSQVIAAVISMLTNVLSIVNSYIGSMTAAGTNLFAGFLSGIISRQASIISAINNIMRTSLSLILSFKGQFMNAGSELINSFRSGITRQNAGVLGYLRNMLSSMYRTIISQTSMFGNAGITLMRGFASGLMAGAGSARSAAYNAVSAASGGLRSSYSSFYSAGVYLAQGFANGISAGSYAAQAKARAMAQAANNAARSA